MFPRLRGLPVRQQHTGFRRWARALYQSAADLLDLPEVVPESGPTVPFPVNPVWQALRARADIGLAKIHAGLNVAGQVELAPSATDNVLPSVYRYGVVVDRAKTLVSIAQQLESSYLSALERLDAANYDLLNADRDLRVAQGTAHRSDPAGPRRDQ